jgi:hypothetical protein
VKQVFYVTRKHGPEVLNLKGGWSMSRNSYRLAFFDSEAEATAAIPAGVECVVKSFNDHERPERSDEGYEFLVMHRSSKLLDAQDAFSTRSRSEAAKFPTKDAALDKVEAIGVDLDLVDLIRVRIRD